MGAPSMGSHRRTPGISIVAGAAAAGVLSGCGTSIVHSRPDAALIAPKVTAVVALSPKLGFGRAAEQRRAARRTGDALIEATGGHAILGEELGRTDPVLFADEIRRWGEDPTLSLTFSVTAARGERIEAVGGVTSGPRPVRRYMDYVVRLDVRRSDQRDVIGSIETCATAFANGPEIDPQGKPLGLLKAIIDAMGHALKSFAPHLILSYTFPQVVE